MPIKTTTLSTVISSDIKGAISNYCKRKGIKLRYFIENALVEQLEDEVDVQAYLERKDEERFSFEDVVKKSKK